MGVLGREHLRDRPTLVVADDVYGPEVEGVDETKDHLRLRPHRPVGVGQGLGVAEAEQVGRETAVLGGQDRDYVAPDEVGKRAAVEQQDGRALALV